MVEEPYYAAYERRYRSVYAQGVTYWSAFPEERGDVARRVEGLLAGLAAGAKVVEFGCGEGFVAEQVIRRGFAYTGVDVSPAAVDKAQRRVAGLGEPAGARIVCGDITRLAELADLGGPFDAALDVSCLHMLVVDADRGRYLRGAWELLRPGAAMLFVREVFRPDAPDTSVASYAQWLEQTGHDYVTPEPREAWENGRVVTIHLPRVPARGRSERQYREELAAAGFEDFALLGPPGEGQISFRVRKPETRP